jgi:hypothetical protein
LIQQPPPLQTLPAQQASPGAPHAVPEPPPTAPVLPAVPVLPPLPVAGLLPPPHPTTINNRPAKQQAFQPYFLAARSLPDVLIIGEPSCTCPYGLEQDHVVIHHTIDHFFFHACLIPARWRHLRRG